MRQGIRAMVSSRQEGALASYCVMRGYGPRIPRRLTACWPRYATRRKRNLRHRLSRKKRAREADAVGYARSDTIRMPIWLTFALPNSHPQNTLNIYATPNNCFIKPARTFQRIGSRCMAVSYTHLRAHETGRNL